MSDPLTATGKAVEEASKTAGIALDLVKRFLGEPLAAAGDIVVDQLRYWQWSNRFRILDKASKKLDERGVPHRRLTPEFFLPFLVESGNVSGETVQEVWAKLLASSVEDSSAEHIGFVKILSGLSGNDIKVIQAMVQIGWVKREDRVARISEHLEIDEDAVNLSINALEYHGFFTPSQKRLKGFAVRLMRLCMVDGKALDAYIDQQKDVERNVLFD